MAIRLSDILDNASPEEIDMIIDNITDVKDDEISTDKIKTLIFRKTGIKPSSALKINSVKRNHQIYWTK